MAFLEMLIEVKTSSWELLFKATATVQTILKKMLCNYIVHVSRDGSIKWQSEAVASGGKLLGVAKK